MKRVRFAPDESIAAVSYTAYPSARYYARVVADETSAVTLYELSVEAERGTSAETLPVGTDGNQELVRGNLPDGVGVMTRSPSSLRVCESGLGTDRSEQESIESI